MAVEYGLQVVDTSVDIEDVSDQIIMSSHPTWLRVPVLDATQPFTEKY